MAATLTAPKTIKLKAETRMASVISPIYTRLFPAGTPVSYHTEARSNGHVGVIELIDDGIPFRAEKPLAEKPCSCGNHAEPNVCRTPRTLTNSRDGQTVETTLTNAEAADAFARLHGGTDSNWLWYWIHRAVNDAKPPQQGGRNVISALDFLADSFVVAVGYGLLRPMIRVHYKDQRFKFYLSARGTICLKSGGLLPGTQDPVGEEEYVGCLLRGQFLPNRDRKMTATETEFFAKLGENPVAFLAQCSKDMCRCCYCYAALEDSRSKEKGYGPVCAKRWGLPWGDGKAGENTPSFARSYNATAHDLLAGIRANPTDAIRWAIFGDWLEENGLNRCEMPTGAKAAKTRMPRND